MDVLIIGGTGLISTAITRQLDAVDHDVTCLTRGETDADLPEGVAMEHADRNDRDALEGVTDRVAPDVVIDMVCFDAGQARAAVDAFAGSQGPDQYIFCSTVDVYRRPLETMPATETALRESDHEGEPVSAYAANKAAAEDVVRETAAIETTIIRPWSTYGDAGPILHTLGMDTTYVDRIRRGKPIVVHGDGTSIWGACHRDDVAGAFLGAVGNPDAYGEAYHVTSEEPMTWNQYHERVARALEAPEPALVHIPTGVLREIAPDRTDLLENHLRYSTVFDNGKAKRDLGFEYTVDFETGVARAVAGLEAAGEIDAWDALDDDAIVTAWRDSRRGLLETVGRVAER